MEVTIINKKDNKIEKLLNHMKSGKSIAPGSSEHLAMCQLSQRALRITMELNSKYHSPDEIREFMSLLTGEKVDESFNMFPPFYTDFGVNIHIGKNVFLNAGCKFQDQGGIYIDDGALIGHNVVLATVNHEFEPEKRGTNIPASIHIGKNVWIGANATILPGVSVGDGAVVAAGAVVTTNVAENTVVGGVPAKVIRKIN